MTPRNPLLLAAPLALVVGITGAAIYNNSNVSYDVTHPTTTTLRYPGMVPEQQPTGLTVPLQYTNIPDTPPVTPPYRYPSSKSAKAKSSKTSSRSTKAPKPKKRSSTPVVTPNPNIGYAHG